MKKVSLSIILACLVGSLFGQTTHNITVAIQQPEFCDVAIPVTTISLDEENISIAPGESRQLTFSIQPGNATNKNVSWTSLDESIATISAGGILTAISTGSTTIEITTEDGGFTDQLTVEVTVAPVLVNRVEINQGSSATMNTGGTLQLTATVFPSNASNKSVTWSSSNNSIVSVNATGSITGIAVGTATVTVRTVDGNFTDLITITVTAINVPVTSIQINQGNTISIVVNGTAQLTTTITPSNATNKNVSWSSSDNSIVTVTAAGVIRGVTEGTAVVTVTTQSGSITDQISVTVSNISIPVTGVVIEQGETMQLPAMTDTQLTYVLTPGNATNPTVTWSSSSNNVAVVNIFGMITTLSEGTAEITITTADGGFTDKITITVSSNLVPVSGVTIQESSPLVLHSGEIYPLSYSITPNNASNQHVIWSSDNELIVQVDEFGLVTALQEGTAIITVTTAEGNFTSSIQLTISNSDPTPNNRDMPKFFSPNNDGIGEYWEWENLEQYNNCHVSVFTRNGRKVFEANPYGNDWNGTYHSQQLSPGDYYYIINCTDGRVLRGALRIIH